MNNFVEVSNIVLACNLFILILFLHALERMWTWMVWWFTRLGCIEFLFLVQVG